MTWGWGWTTEPAEHHAPPNGGYEIAFQPDSEYAQVAQGDRIFSVAVSMPRQFDVSNSG